MRIHAAAIVVAILFAGLGCPDPVPETPDGGSPSQDVGTHTLTVLLTGSGTVTSNPAGINCGAACSASFPNGTQVQLTAAPASGWGFAGFSGACTGTSCTVTLSADVSVSAAFTQIPPPPPPVTHVLTVAVQGQGTVTSTPAGIACAPTCTATFNEGTQVQLDAVPQSGWSFSAYSGACTGTACSVSLSADLTVIATFTQNPPPPPADECAGLVPQSFTSVLAQLPDNFCVGGTSDELGNYLLGFTFDGADTFPEYLFFTLQGGVPTRIGESVMGGSNSSLQVFSQPSGFSTFLTVGLTGLSRFTSYDHSGSKIGEVVVTAGSLDLHPSAAVGIDPSGGTAVARHYATTPSPLTWVTTYQRLDKAGVAETSEVLIDIVASHDAAAVGVALSGNALVIARLGTGLWQGRWIAKGGVPMTDWFSFSGSGWPMARFLMDGSVVVGFRDASQVVTWRYRIADGSTTVDALPAWLAQRSSNVWSVIRNGLAYASWGPSGHCPDGRAEIVAATGKSCGCIQVGFLSSLTSVGRDGSLIVPRPAVNFGTCLYDVYPQLLK